MCEGYSVCISQAWEATDGSIVFDAPKADFVVAGGYTKSEINRAIDSMNVNARIMEKIFRDTVVDEGRFVAQDWRVHSVDIDDWNGDRDRICVALESDALGFVCVFAPLLWNEAAGWHIGLHSENLAARSSKCHVADAKGVVIPMEDMFRNGKLALMVKNAWLTLKARIDAKELTPSAASSC